MIRNARLANVFSLDYEQVDVAVARGVIVGIGTGYVGTETVDAAGKVLIPGMIDGHVHVESSMLTPRRFAEAVVPLGTAAVMADPHEIANVWGIAGIEAMQQNALDLPLDFFGRRRLACRHPILKLAVSRWRRRRLRHCFSRELVNI